MAGLLFIVTVPKKEYENQLKINSMPNIIFENEKASKIIDEPNEKHLRTIIMKCNSTDCLHQPSDVKNVPLKIKNILTDGLTRDCKNLSWDDIKKVFKLNKKRFKISKPVCAVDVLGTFSRDTPLETVLAEIVSRLDIENAVWNSTRGEKFWQVTFSLESGSRSEDLLQVFRTFHIGTRHQSSVSLLPCSLYYKSDDQHQPLATEIEKAVHNSECYSAWSRFSTSIRTRGNLAQVLNDVRDNGALTFNSISMLLIAAFVASVGLIENSAIIIFASLLMSPLLAPITALTLGTVVRDRSLQLMGLKNELLGLFLVVIVGFFAGFFICLLDELYGFVENWPTREMLARCEYRSIWMGILIAIPCGAGCALSVLNGYMSSLAGIAISVSLLPPAVNAGLLWSMSFTSLIMKSAKRRWLVDDPLELALLGTKSFCLALADIVCVFLTGVVIYKIKKVSPLNSKDISWWNANNDTNPITKQNNKEDSLNWDAYTQWCANSLERKENTTEKETKQPYIVHSDTVTFRRRPSVIWRLRAQNLESYCHKIQPEDNHVPLNSQMDIDLEKQIQSLTKTKKPQNTDNEILPEDLTDPNAVTLHRYYNLAYDSYEKKQTSEAPTIEPSLCITVDNNSVANDRKEFDM